MAVQAYLVLLVVASIVTPASTACPSSCNCTLGYHTVTCSRPGQFLRFQQLVDDLPINVSKVVVENQRIENLNLSFPYLAHLTKLVSLTITKSGVKTIDQYALSNLTKLESLDLKDNFIEDVPSYFAQDCFHLDLLDLSSNRITSSGISSDSFHGLSRLAKLTLKRNQLGSGVILHLPHSTSLVEIDLSFNDLTDVSNVFMNPYTASLQVLDLTENRISQLTKNGGSLGFKQLKVLRVSQNLLTQLPVKLLSGMEYLEKINLEGNTITDIPREFLTDLFRLERIDFSSNTIGSLEQGLFSDGSRVKFLDLSENAIKMIPDQVFDNMTSLIELDLSVNQITNLSSESFKGLGRLIDLYLQDNSLNADTSSNCFKPLASLESLHLQDNGMLTIPSSWLSNLPELKFLHLDRNKVASLDGQTFSNLSNLQSLSLHENSLTDFQLDSIFLRLKEVKLGSNSLSSLKETAFSKMPALQIIDIRQNTLVNISSDTFSSNPDLQIIWLQNNKLKFVDPQMFLTLTDLIKLDLSNNPLCLNTQEFSALRGIPGANFTLSNDCLSPNIPSPTNAVSTTATTTANPHSSSQATEGEDAEDFSGTEGEGNNVTLVAVSTTMGILLLATIGLGVFCYVRRRRIRPGKPTRNSRSRKSNIVESKPRVTKQRSVERISLESSTRPSSNDIVVLGSEMEPTTSYSNILPSMATLGSLTKPPSDVMSVGSGHRYEYLSTTREISSEVQRHKFSPKDPANRPLPDRPRHNYSNMPQTGRSPPSRDYGDGKHGRRHQSRERDGQGLRKMHRK